MRATKIEIALVVVAIAVVGLARWAVVRNAELHGEKVIWFGHSAVRVPERK